MLRQLVNKVGYKIMENSPVILITVGVVGTVAATIIACKETLDNSDIGEDYKDGMDELNEIKADSEDENGNLPVLAEGETNEDNEVFTVEVYNKEKRMLMAKAAKRYIVAYAPAVGLQLVSLACILAGFKIIAKRYIALSAAYSALDITLTNYRRRVEKEVGKDREWELYNGVEAKEVETKVKDKDGNEVTKKVTKFKIDENSLSIYSRFFDKNSSQWSEDISVNRVFLQSKEKYWNWVLSTKTRVYLNQVLASLGLPETPEGQIVGWLSDGDGDNKIEFGLFNEYNRKAVNCYNNNWILDFNVDGIIIDKDCNGNELKSPIAIADGSTK